MNRLIRIIGLAPSELTSEEWDLRLTTERNRVRIELENFSTRTRTKTKTSTKRKPAKGKIMSALAEAGISAEELTKLIRKAKEEAKE